jgi:hypothetical protein
VCPVCGLLCLPMAACMREESAEERSGGAAIVCDWCDGSFHLLCVGLPSHPGSGTGSGSGNTNGFWTCHFCSTSDMAGGASPAGAASDEEHDDLAVRGLSSGPTGGAIARPASSSRVSIAASAPVVHTDDVEDEPDDDDEDCGGDGDRDNAIDDNLVSSHAGRKRDRRSRDGSSGRNGTAASSRSNSPSKRSRARAAAKDEEEEDEDEEEGEDEGEAFDEDTIAKLRRCPLCNERCAGYEDLQLHLFTSCASWIADPDPARLRPTPKSKSSSS